MSAIRAPHVAVLLAAGGSTRLGRPKQLLTRGGEPLVRRAARLLLETSPGRLVVVLGAEHDAVREALRGIDAELAINAGWRDGMGTSLALAGERLAHSPGAALVAGCDQPALETWHLQRLIEAANGVASGCAGTAHAGRPGIPAVVPGAWLQQLDDAGDRGFAGRLRALPKRDVFLLDAEELAFDIDTDADLRQAIARGWMDAPI